jgi:AsmA protein
MHRRLRLVLIIAGVLALLVIVTPFLIPVGKFKPMMEEKASAALGRKVQLGTLSLSLLGGSVRAGNLSIGDDPKFSPSPFMTAKSVKVGVKLLPLIFSKTIEVTSVTIERPGVTLLRNTAGQWNFSSLGAPPVKSGSTPPPAGQGAAAPSSPAEFLVRQLNLKDGRISIGSMNSPKRSVYDRVDVSASNVSPKAQFPVKITAGLPGGGRFKLDGNAGPVDETDVALTPVKATLDVSSLNLASSGLLDPSLGLGGIVDLSASLASENGEARTKGMARLSKALFVAGGSPAAEPLTVDFDTQCDLRKDTGVLNPSTVKIGSATSQLSGTYDMTGENTVVNIRLSGDSMPAKDLEAFLPALGIHLPNGAALQAGTLNANFNLAGPTNEIVTTGQVGLFGAKLAGFDLGSKMSNIAALAGVKTGKDLEIEKLTAHLKIAPTGMEIDNFLAVVPSVGSLIGSGTIDAKNNLDLKMAAKLAASGAANGVANPVAVGMNLLGNLQGRGAGCKSAGIPFLIKGTTSNPRFTPDVGGLASNLLKSQLGCAAGASTGRRQGQRQNPVNAIMGLFGKKKKP